MVYKFKDTLTADRLRELLDYNRDTGEFTWKITVSTRRPAGCVAGHRHMSGYITITVDGSRFSAHRLVWLHVYGRWPREEIDHINRIPSDNRLLNLREASRSANNRNNSGLGYYVNKYGKFIASMSVNNRYVYLGSFDRAEDARRTYLLARNAMLAKEASHA